MNGKKKENQLIVFLSIFLLIFLFLGSIGFVDYLKKYLPQDDQTEENTDETTTLNEFTTVLIKENAFSIPIGGKKLNYKYDSGALSVSINSNVILNNIKTVDAYEIDDVLLLKTVSEDNENDIYIVSSDGSILNSVSNILKDYENNIIINSIDFGKSNIVVKLKTTLGLCAEVNATKMLEEGKCTAEDGTNSLSCLSINDKILESELNFTYDKTSDNKIVYTVIEEKTLYYCYQETYGEINIAQ
jgi:hypothetical protein